MWWDEGPEARLGPGPEIRVRVLRALGALDEDLRTAAATLAAAEQGSWVSSAADQYRRRLADLLHDLGHLRAQVGAAYPVALRHAAAADDAWATQAAAHAAAYPQLLIPGPPEPRPQGPRGPAGPTCPDRRP